MFDPDTEHTLHRIDLALARLETSLRLLSEERAWPLIIAQTKALTEVESQHQALRIAVQHGLGELNNVLRSLGEQHLSGNET